MTAFACHPEFMPLNAVLQGLHGGKLNTTELKNQMVVFQFVSLKCQTCKKDLELVGRAAREKHVRFVPISVDAKPSMGVKFFREGGKSVQNYEQSAYFDKDRKVAKLFGVQKSGVIVVNAKGEIVAANSNEMSPDDVKILNGVLDNPYFPEKRELASEK